MILEAYFFYHNDMYISYKLKAAVNKLPQNVHFEKHSKMSGPLPFHHIYFPLKLHKVDAIAHANVVIEVFRRWLQN
jgi:hypothetical protein